MLDDFYPTVDVEFIENIILSSEKVERVITIGDTKAYVIAGDKPLGKRMFYFQTVGDGQVSFNFATAVATKLKRMGQLLKWLEMHRDWKEGAYIVPGISRDN